VPEDGDDEDDPDDTTHRDEPDQTGGSPTPEPEL
jgi:hypothetical protein